MSDSRGKMSPGERFVSWVNGEWETKNRNLFVMECRMSRPPRPAEEHRKREKRRVKQFLGWYPLAAGLICAALVAVLVGVVLSMPPFGHPGNPTNNEVPAYYLEHTVEDTGAANTVTGMILTYRGFDTLGESCVLFMAVTSVMILLWRDEKNTDQHDLQKLAQEEELARRHPDLILRYAAKILTPFLFLFALYVLFYGEESPGGGFSGGTVLGGGLILYSCAFGFERIHGFFTRRTFSLLRLCGLMLYAGLYGYFTFMGANGLSGRLFVFGGLSLPIDFAVGMVVASTVYGFYAMFTRGEL